MENNYNKELKNNEKSVIDALELELSLMEERKPDIRKDGKGDPKYQILAKFIDDVKGRSFEEIYNKLPDYEQHAIVTRLENQQGKGNISPVFVKKIREELYGFLDAEDKEFINFSRQLELEKVLQDMWIKKGKKEK